MKNIFIALIIICSASFSHAQIAKYFINYTNSNIYVKDMESYKGWSGWEKKSNNIGNIGSYLVTEINDLELSNAAIKFSQLSENSRENYYDEKYQVTTCKFIADEPTQEFQFRKKISYTYFVKRVIKNSPKYGSVDEKYEVKGHGYVYSKTSFEDLMKGNADTEIYFEYENEKGEKGYIGYKINRMSNEQIAEKKEAQEEREAEEQAEQEERAREKQKQTKELIQAGGSLLKSILKKN